MCRKIIIFCAIILVLLVLMSDCKKSYGRSRGCRGNCKSFGRNKGSKSASPAAVVKPATPKSTKTVAQKPEPKVFQPKTAAPKVEPTIHKQEATKVQSAVPPRNENINRQQTAPLNQNNNNNNNNPDPSRIGWNTGNPGQYAPNAPPSPSHVPHNQQNIGHNAAPPPYTPHNTYGQSQHNPNIQPPPYNPQHVPVNNAPIGPPPPYNPQHAPIYNGQPPPYNGYPQSHSGYPQTNGYPQQHHGYGPPQNMNGHPYNGNGQFYNGMQPPPTYNGMQGYGPPPPYSGYGHNPGGKGGLLSNLFGGNKYGGSHGSYGGYGTVSGNRYGNYNLIKPRGFGFGFGKVLRNVAAGFLIWHVVSSLTRTPYRVYNYYNNPEAVPQEINLPANLITLCEENVTSLCAENTTPLCTTNNTVLCVALMPATTTCGGDDSSQPCVTSTVSCKGNTDDPDCKGDEGKNITLILPCISNATLQGNLVNVTINVKNGDVIDGTVFCVTTMAQPAPEEQFNCGNVTESNPSNCTNEENVNLPSLNETQFNIPYEKNNNTDFFYVNNTQVDINLNTTTA